MGKKIIGLAGWIRDINNTWAEQFDVRDLDGIGPCLVALSSGEKKTTILVSVSDVDIVIGAKGRPSHEDVEARATAVLNLLLQKIPDYMKAQSRVEFIRLDELLDEAVGRFCWLNPYPTFEMICAKGPVKPFETEE